MSAGSVLSETPVAALASHGGRLGRGSVVLFALFAFAVYLANGRVVTDGDSVPSRLLPFALWHGQTLSLDPVASLADRVPAGKPYREAYWLLRGVDGRRYSFYPVVQPILLAPLYVPAMLYLDRRGWEDWRVDHLAVLMEKLAAALVAAVSAAVVFGLALRRLPALRALLLAAAYAFGTSTWSISSQALWQHGFGEMLLALAIACAAAPPRRWSAFALGVLAGLLACNRPPDALFAVALVAALALRCPRRALVAVAGASAPLMLVWGWSAHQLGHVLGGYGRIGFASVSGPLYGYPLAEGLAGVLVSPGKGLFVFSPFLLVLLGLAHPGIRARLGEARGLAACLSLALLAQCLLYARMDWRAGSSYGPRLLSDALPALAWLSIPVVAAFDRKWLQIWSALVALSIVIHGIGAFCYPLGGSDSRFFPPSVDRAVIAPAVWKWGNFPPLVEGRAGFAAPQLFPGRWVPFSSP